MSCRSRKTGRIMKTRKRFDISVLYVEDEALTREEIHQLLQRRVRELVVARNGDEGIELFRQRNPDLVVTDILMPVRDGLSMTREIRLLNKDVPVIVTTAHSEATYMMDAIDAGVDQYVIKPVESKKLFSAIEKCAELIESRKAAKLYQEERERLVGELQEALARVKAPERTSAHLRFLQEDPGRQGLLESNRIIYKGAFRG